MEIACGSVRRGLLEPNNVLKRGRTKRALNTTVKPEIEITMLRYDDPISFLATKNSEAARRFYVDVLGLKLVADEQFALVFDLNGTMLRMFKVQQLQPAPHTVLGWRVADIAAKVTELKDRGVTFERFEGMSQDTLGVWTSPTGAKVAWFKDPDGNGLSLTQFP
jgi:catechol 2,3-dioxygenase-like lactoylglutathione lyase family enzyme